MSETEKHSRRATARIKLGEALTEYIQSCYNCDYQDQAIIDDIVDILYAVPNRALFIDDTIL